MAANNLSSDKSHSDVLINVEGVVFKTSKTTCTSLPGSLLESLNETSEYYDSSTRMYVFDRDSRLFTHILAAHREHEVHIPRDVCPIRFRNEMEFWKIPHKFLSPCCWKYFYKCDDDITTLKYVMESLSNSTPLPTIAVTNETLLTKMSSEGKVVPAMNGALHGTLAKESLRQRIWLFLEEPLSSKAAKIWCFIYMLVVIISVVLNLIWLDQSVRVDPYLATFKSQFTEHELSEIERSNETFGNRKIETLLFTDPHKALFVIDTSCVLFFLGETIVHFTVCPNKTRYACSPYNVLKALLSLFMIISVVLELRKDLITSEEVGILWFTIRSTNTLRVLLLFRLHKIYISFHLVSLSIRRSTKEMLLLLIMFLFTVVIYGGLIFAAEIKSDMFQHTGTSMWWALVTMTTIGYGDFYPTHALWYIVGVLCAINGLIVIALPIAAIASNFDAVYGRNADLQKHISAVNADAERNAAAT